MILVDRPIWPAHGRHFAHLVSDESFEELHGFAARLGLPERAFHRDHYDLPDAWWDRAVAAGAQPVDSREIIRRLRASGLRRRKPRPEPEAVERSAAE
ncbi:MAG: hypothetical protein JWM89_2203 [Acidimicrobiales bacterium]|nr:hypothetical protein [Acidimicrobiales bacterium]